MTNELHLLLLTAGSIGFIHTLAGPDHYLPFLAMAKARSWSLRKTLALTFICGIGHVASSVILGAIGIAIGSGVQRLVEIESRRGDIAAWLLMSFGLLYMAWGLRRAMSQQHSHEHSHEQANSLTFEPADHDHHAHDHPHSHSHSHLIGGFGHGHAHRTPANITPWILITIFVLGPCEPLIPILMYPAATGGTPGLLMVCLIFTLATIGTMMSVVAAGYQGLRLIEKWRLEKWERYTHAIAGGSIFLCGVGIVFLGL